MSRQPEFVEKPLVSLDAGKLLGMRHFTKASAESATGQRSNGGLAVSSVEMSRLLSKNGVESSPTT